jgi:hypothetical protein
VVKREYSAIIDRFEKSRRVGEDGVTFYVLNLRCKLHHEAGEGERARGALGVRKDGIVGAASIHIRLLEGKRGARCEGGRG